MITSRRAFITGLGAALVTAPAIVRAGSLMPVKQMPTVEMLKDLLEQRVNDAFEITKNHMAHCLFGDSLYVGEAQSLWRIPLEPEVMRRLKEKNSEIRFERH